MIDLNTDVEKSKITEKVQEAKEKLGDRNMTLMAEILELKEFDERKKSALSPFRQEDTNSFCYDSKHYRFRDFGGDNRTVDIVDALMLKGNTYLQAVEKLFKYAEMDVKIECSNKDRGMYHYPKYENGDMTQVYEYLSKRGISSDTVDYMGIISDGKGNMCFNYEDPDDGKLLMCKYRPARTIDKKKGDIKNWCQKGADTTNILFNMTRVKPEGTLVICEGELDNASFIEAGWYQCCSLPLGAGNLHFIDECWDWLSGFDTIIFAGDNDASGKKFMKEACIRLGAANTKYIEYPEYYIERDKDGEISKRTKTKDANDILQTYGAGYLFNLVLQAKETPITSVAKMSEIQELDVHEMDGVKTGLKPLDKELMKIFTGGVTLLTGKPSAGKTTFLNQIVLNAMDSDFPVFLFSRELLNGMSLGWLNNVAAGIRNMHEVNFANGDSFYVVNDDAKKAIKKEYDDKLFIYKDEEGNDEKSLLNSMTMCAKRRGVKCFVLDNLLTVDLGCDDKGENHAQTGFMNKLVRFSIEYNVIVVVVAHPRKIQSGQEIGLFDVAGSSSLVNLATRTISLRRVTDKEKEDEKCKYRDYDVIISSVKDRIFGSTKDIPCMYEKITRRFYTDYDEFDYKYGWDKNTYTNRIPCPLDDRPRPFD